MYFYYIIMSMMGIGHILYNCVMLMSGANLEISEVNQMDYWEENIV